ncbi:MAG: MORN repeat-containing protein [Saprospiraceae bacterium]
MKKVNLFLFFLLGFVTQNLNAQCISGNCINGHGTWKWESGAVYTGTFINGTRYGHGQYTFSNGDVYIGEWQNNQKHGYGVYTFNTSSNQKKLYAGEWIADQRSGIGIMHYKDKTVASKFGVWKKNKFLYKYKGTGCLEGDCYTGFGLYVWNDGSRYEGHFKYGERNGEGVYYYSKGAKYIGNQVNGKRDGQGTYYYPSGSKYVGEWEQEKKHGKGIMYTKENLTIGGIWVNNELSNSTNNEYTGNTNVTIIKNVENCLSGDCINGFSTMQSRNKEMYTGHFKNEKFNGYGVYVYANNDLYIGEWKNNLRHGYGVQYTKSKSSSYKYIGEWIDGRQTGKGMILFDNGAISKYGIWQDNMFQEEKKITGCIEGDCQNGKGTYTWNNGKRYEGNFTDGLFSGEGIYYYSNGNKYIGMWKDGMKHGEGIYYTLSDNTVILTKGIWEKDLQKIETD